MDNLTSFTHIWLILGGYLIFTSIFRIKTKCSIWSKLNKKIHVTVLVLLSAGLLISVINLVFILTPKIADKNDEVDYVILLGGGIDKNGKLPDTVQQRVNTTRDYMLLHPDCICVVTGGTLKWLPYAEAPEIKRQLVLAGVDESKVLVEDQALDTIQNFQLSCKMLAEHDGVSQKEILKSRILVVTSDFHMRRAQRLAARMGFMDVRGIVSRTPAVKVPHSYVREICAYIKLNMRILFTGKPKVIA